MDKVQKALNKIPAKDSEKIAGILEKIEKNILIHLDIAKLKGHIDIFRVRVGDYRIIYKKTLNDIRVLEISKRSDRTYSGY